MPTEKWFPIQSDPLREMTDDGLCYRPAGQVPWGIAAEAYKVYAKKYRNGQSLERLAERGGFGWSELIALLRSDDEFPTIAYAEPAKIPEPA